MEANRYYNKREELYKIYEGTGYDLALCMVILDHKEEVKPTIGLETQRAEFINWAQNRDGKTILED